MSRDGPASHASQKLAHPPPGQTPEATTLVHKAARRRGSGLKRVDLERELWRTVRIGPSLIAPEPGL